MKYVAAALLLFAVACGGGEQTEAPPAGPGSSTIPGETSTTPGGESTTTTSPDDTATTAEGTTSTTSDRMPAPDFTLELSDGGSYTLSEGAKPVYLVFWAEW